VSFLTFLVLKSGLLACNSIFKITRFLTNDVLRRFTAYFSSVAGYTF
jgi:hypothetical protein